MQTARLIFLCLLAWSFGPTTAQSSEVTYFGGLPGCSAKSTLDVVRQLIVSNSLPHEKVIYKTAFTIKAPILTRKEDSIKKIECRANVSFLFRPYEMVKEKQALSSMYLDQYPIVYSVQLTESKQQYVELSLAGNVDTIRYLLKQMAESLGP
jgi:hypothetical protein